MALNEEPNEPNLKAFDAMMRELFPRRNMTHEEVDLAQALVELDMALSELKDLVAMMRSSLAELRHRNRGDFRP